MATADAQGTPPAATNRTEFTYGQNKIAAAGWIKATHPRQEWADKPLIAAHRQY